MRVTLGCLILLLASCGAAAQAGGAGPLPEGSRLPNPTGRELLWTVYWLQRCMLTLRGENLWDGCVAD